MELVGSPPMDILWDTTEDVQQPKDQFSFLGGLPGLNTSMVSTPQIHVQSVSTGPGPTQSQRNYRRLLQRVEQTEAENEKLRQTNRANRTDVIQAKRLLEEVLATASLADMMYDSLSRAADWLMAIRERL